jgi:hypothetical protein
MTESSATSLTRPSSLAPEDRETLWLAYRRLEHPSLAARLTSRLGGPIEKFFETLPSAWYRSLHGAVQASLKRALVVAIRSLGNEPAARPRGPRYHKALGVLSGAAGGLFGLPAVLAELPVTSTLILRSIADIARGEGEDLRDPRTRLACLEVFALGGRAKGGEAVDTGYYGVRFALGLHFSLIPDPVLGQGIARWTPPSLVRFIADVAARFGVVVTEKAAAQMVPLIGAGSGALINLIFIEHFQEIAQAHFALRRLERRYGPELVRAEYEALARPRPRALVP